MIKVRDDYVGIGEWRAAGLANYQDAIEIIGGWHNAPREDLLRCVLNIRARNEPLLIRAGLIADGDSLS